MESERTFYLIIFCPGSLARSREMLKAAGE